MRRHLLGAAALLALSTPGCIRSISVRSRDAAADASPEAAGDLGAMDIPRDDRPDVTAADVPDGAVTDVTADADASDDASDDASNDATRDDATPDDADLPADTGADVPTDTSVDTGIDVPTDASVDTGIDVPTDRGIDVGFDLGFDTGVDVGRDIPAEDVNLCPAGVISNGLCVPFAVTSCETLRASVSTATDGHYTLHIGGRADQPYPAHCVGLGTGLPRTYLVLRSTGPGQNVSTINDAASTTADLTTAWTEVRFLPDQLDVNSEDFTFSVSVGRADYAGRINNQARWAFAADCSLPVRVASMNADLRGLPFAFAREVRVVGYYPIGLCPDPSRSTSQVMVGTGGGRCGSCEFPTGHLIRLRYIGSASDAGVVGETDVGVPYTMPPACAGGVMSLGLCVPNSITSCEQLHAMFPAATSGEYVLHIGGLANQPYPAYCHGDAGTLRTYLTLRVTGPDFNFSSRGDTRTSNNFTTTHWTRLRFEPDMLRIDRTDRTFSVSSGSYTSGFEIRTDARLWGHAEDCVHVGVSAQVDLRGLPFGLPDGSRFRSFSGADPSYCPLPGSSAQRALTYGGSPVSSGCGSCTLTGDPNARYVTVEYRPQS